MANSVLRNLGIVLVAVACSSSGAANAQSIIKQPGAHPRYAFEAEPHVVIRDRPGRRGGGIGPGFRGTIVLTDDGFISKINNSVGVGFGLDWLVLGNEHCPGKQPPDDDCHDHDAVVVPIVLQWNFWLHERWSVFGEPGLALVFDDRDEENASELHLDPFVFYAGGRFHFSETLALTMRLGFPATASVGVSFLL